jgi:hypothetical protein
MDLIYFLQDLVIRIFYAIFALYFKNHLGKRKLKITILTHCIDTSGVTE